MTHTHSKQSFVKLTPNTTTGTEKHCRKNTEACWDVDFKKLLPQKRQNSSK